MTGHLMVFISVLVIAFIYPVWGEDLTDFDEFDEQTIGISDPLEIYNRLMFKANDKLYVYIIHPVAEGYSILIPKEIRHSISGVFQNSLSPMRLINNALQFKFHDASVETARFIINTTVGIGGLFDPAKAWLNLEHKSEDLGQTLGKWGVGPGPYIVLPLLGPSTLRDTIGMVGGFATDPVFYIKKPYSLIIKTVEITNKASFGIKQYNELKENNVDFYTGTKSIYMQHRERLIKD
jgi:phospholipid-binding lipoprotein MlaA